MKKIIVVVMTLLISVVLLAQEEAFVVVYEKELEGILTTSGEYFSHKELTAGHESLPMGSIVEFVNPANQDIVKLTINDRILESEGMYWISGYAAELLGLQSIYPTKVLTNIIYKPEVKEVYTDEVELPTIEIDHENIETVEYAATIQETPEVAETPAITYQEPVETYEEPQIVSTTTTPILDGLSENLETAIGDPRIPKSACMNVKAYGIHIYTGYNSKDAIEVSQRLQDKFACSSYIEKYCSPIGNCYRVIAGDYSSENDALKWYNKLSVSIPDIFLVEIY